MTDRQIAYKQNLAGLEKAWTERLQRFAREAIRQAGDEGYEDQQLRAREIVEDRLFASEQWGGVEAADISDLAYEVVGKAWREALEEMIRETHGR